MSRRLNRFFFTIAACLATASIASAFSMRELDEVPGIASRNVVDESTVLVTCNDTSKHLLDVKMEVPRDLCTSAHRIVVVRDTTYTPTRESGDKPCTLKKGTVLSTKTGRLSIRGLAYLEVRETNEVQNCTLQKGFVEMKDVYYLTDLRNVLRPTFSSYPAYSSYPRRNRD